MAENIFSDVTNEELDTTTLFAALTDEEEDTEWKEWAKENFIEFVIEQAEEGIFNDAFEWWHAFILRNFFELIEPIQLTELRQAQIDMNHEEWKAWMMSVAMNMLEEDELRFDMVTDMFEVDWHNNEYTHGCYGAVDFWEDLSTVDLEDLKKIRKLQLDDAPKADYDELCNHIFGVAA